MHSMKILIYSRDWTADCWRWEGYFRHSTIQPPSSLVIGPSQLKFNIWGLCKYQKWKEQVIVSRIITKFKVCSSNITFGSNLELRNIKRICSKKSCWMEKLQHMKLQKGLSCSHHPLPLIHLNIRCSNSVNWSRLACLNRCMELKHTIVLFYLSV